MKSFPTQHAFQVDAADGQKRLDVFLTENLTEAPSRTFIKKLIDEGHVTVDGKVVKAHYKVAVGQKVIVTVAEINRGPLVLAEDIPLDIFYEDEFLLVVNKPAGMLVHPVHGVHNGTLVNALMYHCRQLSDVNTASEDEDGFSSPANVALIRPGIVHRLDRETSGLLVVAKDNKTHVGLARQFERHQVRKKYVAVVKGTVNFDEGVIDVPLGRHPRHWDKKAVSFEDGSKEAKTFYRVIRRFESKMTLMALFPESGRTHQLRVHMAHLGHPILGDEKYGGAGTFPRMALHAQGIRFRHPLHPWQMEFSSAIPAEIRNPLSVERGPKQQ